MTQSLYARLAPLALGVLLSVFVLGVVSLEAQTPPERDVISTQPSIIEPDEPVEPGDVMEYSVRVTNRSDRTETFYPGVEDMKGISPQGAPLFADDEERTGFDLSSWVEFHQDSLTLGAGEAGEFSFTVRVPNDAGPRGHYGAFFVTREAPEVRETGAGVAVKVGTILSFRIAGDAHVEASIREFFSDQNIYQNGDEIELAVTVENRGNVLVRPRGAVTVYNMWGDDVAQIAVNHPRPGGVFPGADQTFRVTWDPEGFAFGRYHAEIDLTYEGRTISDQTSFWVVPLNVVVPVALGLTFFILIIFFGVRMYVRRQLRALHGTRRIPRGAHAGSAPVSKLTAITLAVILFTLVFAAVVFILFA